MFGLMTKAAHEAAVAAAKMDGAVHYQGKVDALKSQIGDLTRSLAKADQDVNVLKVQLADQQAIVAALKPDAEKWRAKVAKDKVYEAGRRKEVREKARVRKPSAKTSLAELSDISAKNPISDAPSIGDRKGSFKIDRKKKGATA